MGSTQRNDTTRGRFLARLAVAWDKAPLLPFGKLLTLGLTEGQLASLEHLTDSEIAESVENFARRREMLPPKE
jgi:hypothetical protein